MTHRGEPRPASAAEFDQAATRALAAILATRTPRHPFAYRVEAGLAAALELFDRESRLASTLLVEAGPDPILRERQASWAETYANLLRDTASQAPELHLPPSFLEPQLIAGLRARLRGARRVPGAPPLLAQLPAALEFLLAYYMEPDQLAPIVGACRASLASIPVHGRRQGGGSLGPL
jgi:hypothetical protein